MSEQQLRDRIEELEEEVRQLREQLDGRPELLPPEWRLTRTEARVVAALATAPRGYLSREGIQEAMYYPREPETGINLVSVVVSKVRRKLKPYNLEIRTRWGDGFEFEPKSREAVKAAMQARAPA